MAGVKPLGKSDLPEFKEQFDHYEKTRGFLPNSILTMARRPDIARVFMEMNRVVLYQGTVPEELKMLVSLISSQASGCRYCQAHMSNLASIWGSSKERIEKVWEFETSDLFTQAERAALRLAMHAGMVPNQVTEADFESLRPHFSDDEIVELVATLALFGYLNRWNDTMGTELEDLPLTRAAELLGAEQWQPGKHAAKHPD